MKFFTLSVALLATFTTASTIPAAPGSHPIDERGVVKIGTDFTSGLLDKIAKFPGTKEIKDTLLCIRKDKHWKVDYSKKGQGVVTFTNVPPKCCNTAQAGWNKYKQDWQKLTTPVFNTDCTGGTLTKMKPSHIDKLHRIIGDGNHGK